MPDTSVHYEMTYEEYRANVGYKCHSDWLACPEKLCRTGNFHAKGTLLVERVTCEECSKRLKLRS
jgi:hypothetical protein